MSSKLKSDDFETYSSIRRILMEKKLLLIAAAERNDVEKLKRLLDSPRWCSIRDHQGNSLLQISMIQNNKEAFDFLLSIEGFPLNATNYQRETALEIAIKRLEDGEYYATKLIEKGASITSLCDLFDNSLLHYAISRGYIKIAQYLIENGADINRLTVAGSGFTPLHLCLSTNNSDIINEGTSMLLYYGADPTIRRSLGKNAMEDALDLYHIQNIESTQEHLFYYVVDNHYKLPINFLLSLIENKSPFFHKMVQTVKDVVFNIDTMASNIHYYINSLFTMDLECLAILIQRFDHVIKAILWNCDNLKIYNFKPTSIENFKLLLESHLMYDIIEFISSISIHLLVGQLYRNQISLDVISDLVLYLLTYGLHVYDEDLETVFEIMGYCQLFKVLLHQDIKKLTTYRNIVPAVIYDVTLDIDNCLRDPQNYIVNTTTIDYFATPKLKDLCHASDDEKLVKKAQELPQVPLLLELARNATRKFLVTKNQIRTSRDFYSVLQRLPISKIHEKIIALEPKLYC